MGSDIWSRVALELKQESSENDGHNYVRPEQNEDG